MFQSLFFTSGIVLVLCCDHSIQQSCNRNAKLFDYDTTLIFILPKLKGDMMAGKIPVTIYSTRIRRQTLDSGFQSLGFQIPWVRFSQTLYSTSKDFPDSGIRIPLHWVIQFSASPPYSPLLEVHETDKYSTYAPFLLKQHQPKQLHLSHQLWFEMLYLSELVSKTLHGER